MINIVTIKEIAKISNVSIATVSRIMNNSPNVSDLTREKVMEVVKEYGYQPNLLGRNLRLNSTKTVLVLLNTIANSFFSKIIRGMENVCAERGYTLIICTTRGESKKEDKYLNMLRNHQVDGIVFAGSMIDDDNILSMQGKFPMVSCTGFIDFQTLPYVTIDDEQAAYDAVSLLVASGYRRIGIISAQNSLLSTGMRENGYKRALADVGVAYDPSLRIFGTYGFVSGKDAMKQFLKMEDCPSAIFAISDHMAAGALREILDAGLRVPEDIAIVGFDNNNISKYMQPQITTVVQPRKELGECAMNILLDIIEGKKVADPKKILPHELIIRGSTI